MKVAVFFADMAQIRMLSEQNKNIEILIVSEIPANWIKNCGEYKYLSLNNAINYYHDGVIRKIIIFPILKKNLNSFYLDLSKKDINEEDILYVSLRQAISYELNIDGFSSFGKRKDLDYISIHIMKQCNLKCAYCTSMAGLVKDSEKVSYSKTCDSIYKLSRIYDSVNYIQLLGGEPMLNDKLLDYCIFLRKLFPNSYIEIVTNGTLLFSKEKKFFEILNSLDIAILVSYYPIVASIIDDINLLLRRNNISYSISDKITYFEKFYDFSGTSDIEKTFLNCQASQYCKNGLTLLEEYIYPCVAPIALKRAEIIQNTSDYGIQISNNTTHQDISSLIQPLQICKYCHMDQFTKWHQLESNEINKRESWCL